MKSYRIRKTTFEIPEGWDEVGILKHAAAVEVLQKEGLSKSAILLETMSALTGIPLLILKTIPIDDFQDLHAGLQFYFDTRPEVRPIDQFEFGDQVYVVPSDIGNRTFGEFVDMDDELEQNQDNLWRAVPGIIAIYCRPLGEDYDPDKGLERREVFKDLPLTICEGLAAFFLTNEEQSRTITGAFSIRMIHLIKRVRRIENSLSSTGGVRRLVNWPARICLNRIKSRARILESYSVGSPNK